MSRPRYLLWALAALVVVTGGCVPERLSPGDRAARNAVEEHNRAREHSRTQAAEEQEEARTRAKGL